MSYILEALKKLEQKREREEPPTLFALSHAPRTERRKQASWPYLLAGVLLLNAVAMIWWVGEKQAEKGRSVEWGKGEAVQEKAAVPRESPPPAPFAAPAKKETPPAAEPAAKTEVPPATQGMTQQAPAAPREEVRDVPQPRAPKAVEAERSPGAPETREERNKRTHGLVFKVSELPSAVRGALPEFRISGHAYSPEPQTRVARINEKILQEGQELIPGLRLEEIVPEGVVFGYRGYHFRVDVNGRP